MASELKDDASCAATVIIPTIVTTTIALIITLLRFYVRRFIIQILSWDDFFNALATLCVLVVLGLVVVAQTYGFGRHLNSLEHDRAVYAMKLLRISEFFLIMSTVFLKISISLFLKRLFLKSKKWQAFFWGFIAFNTITSVVDASIIFPQCVPIEYLWNKHVHGHCWSNASINATGIAQGAIAAATDFILSILPIIFLWSIRLPRRVKAGICTLMALGFASGGFAIARTILVPILTKTKDPTWDLSHLFLWGILEATFGVIAAAAPCIRPLLGHSSRSTDYTSSKSRGLPLHSIRIRNVARFGRREATPKSDHEARPEQEVDGDSQSQLCAQQAGRNIMKTTSVEVVSSPNDEAPQIWDDAA